MVGPALDAGRPVLEQLESDAIEADQAAFGRDPQIAVRRLRDAVNGTADVAAVAAPGFAQVLRHVAVGIDGARRRAAGDRREEQQSGKRRGGYGRYWNRSITTSMSFTSGVEEYRK